MKMNKVYGSAKQALSDVSDGASVAIAGFGRGHRFPLTLIRDLGRSGVRELCVVCNSLGVPGGLQGQVLAENHQIRRLISSFSTRPGMPSASEEQILAGEIELELVPQGVLVERLRAAGAGIPGFYVATGAGTELSQGKETRIFDDQEYVFERALPVDFALVRAHRADTVGNLQFRGASENFNPSFAKAARVAIAEVDEIVDVGELPPEDVDLPGVFVDRVVPSEISMTIEEMAANAQRKTGKSARTYGDKVALPRAIVARRATELLEDGWVVNLGLGIPTLVSNWIKGRDIWLHAENGLLGYGEVITDKDVVDLDIFNPTTEFVSLVPGASFFDSVTSFEIARGGHLDAVILGAYQVDAVGRIANWNGGVRVGGGIGGAMDLLVGEHQIIILMEHLDPAGKPKVVEHCTLPVSCARRVDVLITDLGLFTHHSGERLVLEEVAEGWTVDEVLALTPGRVEVAPDVKVMSRD